MYFKKAFSLAEVLITLAIIGVVAALTIPSVIQSYKKTVVQTRLAKFYSTFNQAINTSQAYNGDYMTWDFPNDDGTAEEVRQWHDKYFLPYVKVLKTETVQVGKWYRIVDYLPDGSAVIISSITTWLYFPSAKDLKLNIREEDDADGNTPAGTLYPDVTRSGIDFFTFQFTPQSSNVAYHNKSLLPYTSYWDGTIESLKNHNSYGCYRQGVIEIERAYCAQLIMMNGWKIPKDYPFKF